MVKSEITGLISNQIAINRLMSANVWGTMMNGMPMLLVNSDMVNQEITNDPGQIIEVFGSATETKDAVKYVAPPELSSDFKWSIESLISNTMRMAGVNDVLLGDVRPQNSAALEIAKQSSLVPLNYMKKRVYRFYEEMALIWVEFWTSMYGRRFVSFDGENGTEGMDFYGDKYRNMIFSAKADGSESIDDAEFGTVNGADTSV